MKYANHQALARLAGFAISAWGLKTYLGTIIAGLLVVTLAADSAMAISIRDDRSQSDYADQLSTAPFSATGRIADQSGTMVAPTWVLASAHGAGGPGSTFETINGSANVVQRIPFGGDPDPNDALDGFDFALFELDAAIPGPVAQVFSGSIVELPRVAVYTGSGSTGNGKTGATDPPTRMLLAGRNLLDRINSNHDNIVGSDFDDPGPDGTTGQDLEMGLTDGDSGGGLWVDTGSGYELLGVHSGVGGIPGNEPLGQYGQINWSTAINDDVRQWIFETIPEPTSGVLILMTGSFLAMRRSVIR